MLKGEDKWEGFSYGAEAVKMNESGACNGISTS